VRNVNDAAKRENRARHKLRDVVDGEVEVWDDGKETKVGRRLVALILPCGRSCV